MNGQHESAVQALMARAELAAALVPGNGMPQSILGYLLACISSEGVADLDDLSTAVELFERDVQYRLNGNGGAK